MVSIRTSEVVHPLFLLQGSLVDALTKEYVDCRPHFLCICQTNNLFKALIGSEVHGILFHMALIKCSECGHEVSDKANVCPNCGCPIKETTLVQEEIRVENNKRKRNSYLWIVIALFICLIGGGTFYCLKDLIFEKEINAVGLNSDIKKIIKGRYAIILYNDNVGEFYNPKGGRICSFKLSDGRQEPMRLTLSQSIYILEKSTDLLYLSHDRLFADYTDYLNYNSSYKPDKSLGVAVDKKEIDDGVCFIVSLSPSMIEQKNIPIHQIKVSDNIDYTMLLYNDEYGTLFDGKGERLCGILKGYTNSGEICVKLSKSMSIYGITTSELLIKDDNLYTSISDLVDDIYKSDGEPSKRIAFVKRIDDKDATIFTFSKVSEQKEETSKVSEQKEETSKVSKQKEETVEVDKWTGASSVEEFQRKIVGTTWHCDYGSKYGHAMKKFVISKKEVKVYNAFAYDGEWSNDYEIYSYSISQFRNAEGKNCIALLMENDSTKRLGHLQSMMFMDKCTKAGFVVGTEIGGAGNVFLLEYGDFSWSDEL